MPAGTYPRRPSVPKSSIQIPSSLANPPTLAIPEQLLFNINRFISVSLSSGIWVMVKGKICRGTICEDHEHLDNFINLCGTSAELIRTKQFIEGRRTLSRACSIVKAIITAENPQSVEYFLDTLLDLVRANMPEMVVLLGGYISNMAGVCLPPSHFLAQILLLLGNLNPCNVKETLLECWQCLRATYTRSLGPCHQISLDTEYKVIKYCVAGQSLGLAEKRFRQLQVRAKAAAGVGSETSCGIFSALWGNLYEQEKYAEAEIATHQFLDHVPELKHKEFYVLALRRLAISRYKQGKLDLDLMDAMETLRIHLPPPNAWALLEYVNLQSLWKEWGFNQELELEKAIEL